MVVFRFRAVCLACVKVWKSRFLGRDQVSSAVFSRRPLTFTSGTGSLLEVPMSVLLLAHIACNLLAWIKNKIKTTGSYLNPVIARSECTATKPRPFLTFCSSVEVGEMYVVDWR
jgi:hypothetical protein